MQSYSDSVYNTTLSADMARNKTEIAGDPLKARYKALPAVLAYRAMSTLWVHISLLSSCRYNIDELASPMPSPGNRAVTQQETITTTTTTVTSSHGVDEDSTPRSILKSDSKESNSTSGRNISFAEQALVAEEVLEG